MIFATAATLLLALMMFLFPRPVRARRTYIETVTKTTTLGSRGWSSSGGGAAAFDHRVPDPKTVATVSSQKKPAARAPDDIDHPNRAFIEHHPYASSAFSFDPNFEMDW